MALSLPRPLNTTQPHRGARTAVAAQPAAAAKNVTIREWWWGGWVALLRAVTSPQPIMSALSWHRYRTVPALRQLLQTNQLALRPRPRTLSTPDKFGIARPTAITYVFIRAINTYVMLPCFAFRGYWCPCGAPFLNCAFSEFHMCFEHGQRSAAWPERKAGVRVWACWGEKS
jgi:hypothetical protein